MNVYLDNAATTPLKQEVKDYIISILDCYGNPSSVYDIGSKSKQIIRNARHNVAKFINAEDNEIIFTPSGSASNTLGIRGYCEQNKDAELYYSSIAHKSIQKCAEDYVGIPIIVDSFGNIKLEWLENELRLSKPHTLVVIDYANSEIGTIQDVETIIKLVHKYNDICMLDCTGSISTIPVDVKKLDVDMLSFSAHKLGALKGCGVLYKKPNIQLKPLIYGSQENGLSAGTENMIGIASLGKAVENYKYDCMNCDNRDYVWDYICNEIQDVDLIGEPHRRLIHNLYLCFNGVNGEALMTLMDMSGIQVSTGSACASGDKTISPTLLAIGMDNKSANSCLRITFSGNETIYELEYVCNQLKKNVNTLRILSQ